eukprot:350318-Chlamydomonas_euryale.AAC.23
MSLAGLKWAGQPWATAATTTIASTFLATTFLRENSRFYQPFFAESAGGYRLSVKAKPMPGCARLQQDVDGHRTPAPEITPAKKGQRQYVTRTPHAYSTLVVCVRACSSYPVGAQTRPVELTGVDLPGVIPASSSAYLTWRGQTYSLPSLTSFFYFVITVLDKHAR